VALSDSIKEWAERAGFDRVAIASTEAMPEAERATLERVRSGMLAGMDWFTEERARTGCRPSELLSGAASVIVLAKCYLPPEDRRLLPPEEPYGRIARYAWGEDYHDLLPRMIDELLERINRSRSTLPKTRALVDSGPLAEKALAVRSGMGWYGKSGLVITPDYGSWVFLSEVISDLKLKPDRSVQRDCGDCHRCVDNCPTGALVSPYVVDARRCISYLTIEHRGAIPTELRQSMGNWIFGCDVCQEVCPHNRLVRPTEDPVFAARKGVGPYPTLHSLLALDKDGFKRLFARNPILRARRRGLLRNVAVALGNSRDSSSVPVLAAALRDPEPLVRSHAAWAMGQIGGRRARLALEDRLTGETDVVVAQEMILALER